MAVKISLGPIQYYWPLEKIEAFYDAVLTLPIDIVYLGETVCSKRKSIRTEGWLNLAEKLQRAGKSVFLSTLTLIESGGECSSLKSLCNNGKFLVEANDMGAVYLLAALKIPFALGPGVHVYNFKALELLYQKGAMRWVPPFELPLPALEAILNHIQQKKLWIETEIFVYGKIPLAYSARCFTARHYQLPKDHCEFRCLDHPEGIPVHTQEGKLFLTMNGIQVQSGENYNLLSEVQTLKEKGVDIFRVSPNHEISSMVNPISSITGDLSLVDPES